MKTKHSSESHLRLVDGETSIIDAALAIAEERENNTRALCRAVLTKDYEAAERLAKELLPNESNRINQSQYRRASR